MHVERASQASSNLSNMWQASLRVYDATAVAFNIATTLPWTQRLVSFSAVIDLRQVVELGWCHVTGLLTPGLRFKTSSRQIGHCLMDYPRHTT